VRSLEVRVSIKAHITPTLIVGHDQNDIWAIGLRQYSCQKEKKDER
jgi:hypothetical protein